MQSRLDRKSGPARLVEASASEPSMSEIGLGDVRTGGRPVSRDQLGGWHDTDRVASGICTNGLPFTRATIPPLHARRSVPTGGKNAPNGRDQAVEFDRLGVELVAPGGERLFTLSCQRMSRKGDHGNVAGCAL